MTSSSATAKKITKATGGSVIVEALKTELESTFKEEISVYFDINPHDGLLETHDVNASLKEKLKCLIFIPIISQTYCDSKSFAWQYEFASYNKMAKEDQFADVSHFFKKEGLYNVKLGLKGTTEATKNKVTYCIFKPIRIFSVK